MTSAIINTIINDTCIEANVKNTVSEGLLKIL